MSGDNKEIKNDYTYSITNFKDSESGIQLIFKKDIGKESGQIIGEGGYAEYATTWWTMKFNKNDGTWALESYSYPKRYLQRTGDEADPSGDALIGKTLRLSYGADINDPSCQWYIQSYPDSSTFRIFAPHKAPGVAVELSSTDRTQIALNVMTDWSLWKFDQRRH